jgi:hypothetical protein
MLSAAVSWSVFLALISLREQVIIGATVSKRIDHAAGSELFHVRDGNPRSWRVSESSLDARPVWELGASLPCWPGRARCRGRWTGTARDLGSTLTQVSGAIAVSDMTGPIQGANQ